MLTQVLLLASASLALAQSSTAALPAASPITIVGGAYNGQQIVGYHVGAAQDFQVALSSVPQASSGDTFYYNSTSSLFMDTSVFEGEGLPCYIIKASEYSTNSGPLECGAATDASYPSAGTLGSDGSVNINGIQSWWVCSVNTTNPYGVIANTVVGGFSAAVPNGPGMLNCSAITGLKLAGGSVFSSTTSSTTVPPKSSSTTTLPLSSSSKSSDSWGTSTTVTTAAPVTTTVPASSSKAHSSSTSPAASTYTGGASAKDISKLGMLVAGGVAMLL
ncbi:hypothetical protein PV08_02314 [Exophiala spinifera]|uniref:Ig-like domain-containing protein n=1 Tax=Exophiala spinifera TaxID=91928 RepID=A0A0D1ZZD7_9EURO|nr:uncharacterized protein PV08_02314 [Exophiala spinifera]KIW18027.1 hypothetical protein PV08_02314 [Exophiala spinifera]